MVYRGLKAFVPAFVAGFVTAVLLATCGGCGLKAGPCGPDLPDIRSSVGRISITTESGGGHCSGFLVAPGVVMTAAHCVDEPAEYSYDGRAAEFLAKSAEADLGLLRVESLDGPVLAVAGSDPEFGEGVGTVGYPAGVFLYVRGQWSGRDADHGVLAMVSYFGASGSAVINADGDLVCVLVAIRTDYKGVTYCVPQDQIRRFLFQSGVKFQRAS